MSFRCSQPAQGLLPKRPYSKVRNYTVVKNRKEEVCEQKAGVKDRPIIIYYLHKQQ